MIRIMIRIMKQVGTQKAQEKRKQTSGKPNLAVVSSENKLVKFHNENAF